MSALPRLAGLVLLALVPGHLRAQDGGPRSLSFTIGPSGVEGESLDEKLARRERSFRFICIGCSRAPGPVDTHPFEPIRTLNAPGLSGALEAPPGPQREEPPS